MMVQEPGSPSLMKETGRWGGGAGLAGLWLPSRAAGTSVSERVSSKRVSPKAGPPVGGREHVNGRRVAPFASRYSNVSPGYKVTAAHSRTLKPTVLSPV